MPINANLKAQVQARINAASNGSTLEELWNLKLIARGLGCNESNIDNLIELRLNEFGASTELKSLLQGALSVRSYAQNIVWKTQTFLMSDIFNRPSKIVGDTVWATGCASGGGGGAGFSGAGFTCGGFGGEFCINRPIRLTSGVNSFTVVIPAGGNAAAGIGDGSKGGDLQFGTSPVLLALRGGDGGVGGGRSAAFALSRRGIRPAIALSATDVRPADIVTGFSAGETAMDNTSSNPSVICTGGAPGLFGPGGDGNITGTATSTTSARPNTGAGGGASRDRGGGVGNGAGAGGSARLDLAWLEYE